MDAAPRARTRVRDKLCGVECDRKRQGAVSQRSRRRWPAQRLTAYTHSSANKPLREALARKGIPTQATGIVPLSASPHTELIGIRPAKTVGDCLGNNTSSIPCRAPRSTAIPSARHPGAERHYNIAAMERAAASPQPGATIVRHWTLLVLGGLLVLLGLLFLRIILPYLLPLFLALVAAIVVRPQYERVVALFGGRQRLAALATCLSTVLVLVIPIATVTTALALRLYVFWLDTRSAGRYAELVRRFRERFHIDEWLRQLQDRFPGAIDADAILSDAQAAVPDMVSWLATKTLGVAATTFGLLGGIISVIVAFVIFVFALYYFLAEGPVLLQRATELIPLPLEYQKSIFDAFTGTVQGAITAMFVGALAQGLVLGLGLLVLGAPSPLIFTILAILACLIPFVGSSLVWVPMAFWFWVNDHQLRAILLVLYAALIVSSVDNVVRIYVMHGTAKLHPLLALVSILGGIAYFGLWGVFVGPLAASCLYALAEVFKCEFNRLTETASTKPPAPPPQPDAGETVDERADTRSATAPAAESATRSDSSSGDASASGEQQDGNADQ